MCRHPNPSPTVTVVLLPALGDTVSRDHTAQQCWRQASRARGLAKRDRAAGSPVWKRAPTQAALGAPSLPLPRPLQPHPCSPADITAQLSAVITASSGRAEPRDSRGCFAHDGMLTAPWGGPTADREPALSNPALSNPDPKEWGENTKKVGQEGLPRPPACCRCSCILPCSAAYPQLASILANPLEPRIPQTCESSGAERP